MSGFVDLVDGVSLRARALVVPTAPGLASGDRAAVLADAPDAVQIVSHPPFPGLGATERAMPAPLRRGTTRLGFYSFDHGGERVLRVRLRAVPPEAAPHLLGLCEGPPPISRAPLNPRAPAGSG